MRWRRRWDSSSLPWSSKRRAALLQLLLDRPEGIAHLCAAGDVLRRREEAEDVALAQDLARQGVELEDALDVVAEELQAGGDLLVRRLDVDDVATDAEPGAAEVHVVALVLELDQLALEDVAPDRVALLQLQRLAQPVLRGADAVDARDAGDDDDVAPGQQRAHRAGAQAVDLVVAGGVLLDVGVGAGDVRLGLVVVVEADEVLDGVVREELPELRAQLRRQGLVGRHHQRRPLHLLDDVGHGEGLAAAGHPQQGLLAHALTQAVDQPGDRLGLVAGGLEGTLKTERGHD